MNDNDLHLKLLAGQSINIDGIGELKPLTLNEIIKIGESEYYNLLYNTFLFDKNNLVEKNEAINNASNFEILISFVVFNNSFRELFFYAFNLFFDKTPKLFNEDFIYVDKVDETGKTVFTEEKFEEIKRILKIANFIQDEEKEEYVAGNDRAKKFMDLLKKKKEQYANVKKTKINLHSIISAVRWKPSGLNKDIFELTIYELYDAYRRLENIDYYNFTLTGIYTGNVDAKKINLSDINWANILKIK